MDIPLSLNDLHRELENLDGWSLNTIPKTSITKTYEFKTIDDVISFVNNVVLLMKEQNHQPMISINNIRVIITLTTKSGVVTTKSIKLAKLIDEEYNKAKH